MRLVQILLLILLLSLSICAQEVKKESEPIQQPKKIALSPDDAKSFQQAIDKANKEIEQAKKEADLANKLLELTQKVGQLEVQNTFLQLEKKYNAAGYEFNFEKREWVEKEKPPASQPGASLTEKPNK